MYLFRRLVNPSGDVGHKGSAVFGLRQAAHQNNQGERAGCIDNRRVVMNFGELSGLMGHARAGRQAGGNGLVEFLARQNLHHLAGGVQVDGLAFGDGLEKNQQAARGGGVVHSFFVRLIVFDPAQYVHAIGVSACTVARIFSTPSFSTRRLVARLLLTVIISSQNWLNVRVCPTALYRSVSESSAGSRVKIEASTKL